ncbi:hypothetical protein [Streptomyces sp. ISL-86]|uniref:hypothetical protein n=1 Tax=Streptomyces sp. ISL-86 TaxID=2819187 RepID=UPI001BE6DDA3|nr:hypothetical protein [Streptomyces sp. ISL-86]MBT2456498.1 hypothetical protein [Streptomyces sp. ISL-86]
MGKAKYAGIQLRSGRDMPHNEGSPQWRGLGVPLVHVHGIGNRVPQDPEQAAVRDALYRQHVLAAVGCDQDNTRVWSPWWGGLVAEPAWGWASLDVAGMEQLGGIEEASSPETAVLDVAARIGAAEPDRVLVAAAATSLQWAIDIVCSSLVGTEDELREGAAFCGKATAYWAQRSDTGRRGDGPAVFPWLVEVSSDTELLERLSAELAVWHPRPVPNTSGSAAGWETFGATGGVPRAARLVLRRLNYYAAVSVTRGGAALLRRRPTRSLALLLGDVMGYFAQRDTTENSSITALVSESLEEAADHARQSGEPLVVMAHSMGGNIIHDVLSHFRPHLQVDLLVTAGTQIGLFEELKLFRASDRSLTSAGGRKVPALPNVSRWINVVDPADPLAFAAAPVFSGAEDLHFGTGAWWAHGGYVTSPHFHHRVALRAAEGQR